MKKSVLLIAVLTVTQLTSALRAASIIIPNSSFESPAIAPSNNVPARPITNWTLEGPGDVGVWNIIPGSFYTVGAPVGSQIAFVGGIGAGLGAAISQTLSDTLLPATIYSLTGFAGHPNGYGGSTGTTFTAQLFAGSTLLSTLTSFGPDGNFAPFAMNFDSSGSSAIGQQLKIRLSSNKPQVGFDGISLTTTPAPEPTTGILLLLGAGFFASRRRTQ